MKINGFDMSALDGGWGAWKSNTTGNCTVKTRECDNPVKCGAGSSCRGPSVEKIGCKGKYMKLATKIKYFFQMKYLVTGVCGVAGPPALCHVVEVSR